MFRKTISRPEKESEEVDVVKDVTIYFKSGNVLKIKCKVFKLVINGDTRNLDIKPVKEMSWMIDLNQIEAYTCI